MSPTRKTMALLAMLCLSINAWAQFDDSYSVEDWSLDPEEEETPQPQHKEYKNALYIQYSPSRYKVSDDCRVKFKAQLEVSRTPYCRIQRFVSADHSLVQEI